MVHYSDFMVITITSWLYHNHHKGWNKTVSWNDDNENDELEDDDEYNNDHEVMG